MTDLERVIEQKQRRLDEISRPEIWERYTRNMESGELMDFTQSFRDSQTIVAALRKAAEDDKAQSEGRLVVLPCKIGRTVYIVDGGKINRCVTENALVRNGLMARKLGTDAHYAVYPDGIGKTVFLTRAEAEAALGGDGDGT